MNNPPLLHGSSRCLRGRQRFFGEHHEAPWPVAWVPQGASLATMVFEGAGLVPLEWAFVALAWFHALHGYGQAATAVAQVKSLFH